jgi:hypothetical protein
VDRREKPRNNMNVYATNIDNREKWQPHYMKYERAFFVVMVNGHWVEVEECACGSIHSYQVLNEEPGSKLPRKLISDLSDEIREHLVSKVPLAKLESSQ